MLQSGGMWTAVLVNGAFASGITTIGEWRVAKRSDRREHLRGAASLHWL